MEKSFPTIACGLFVQNERDTIVGCLNSLLSQDYPNFKIYVCDNASTDGTFELVRDHASKQKNISFFHFDEPVPIYENSKRVLQAADCEYFFFGGGDDYYESNFVSSLFAKIRNAPEKVVSYSVARLQDIEGKPLGKVSHSEFEPLFNSLSLAKYTLTASSKDKKEIELYRSGAL